MRIINIFIKNRANSLIKKDYDGALRARVLITNIHIKIGQFPGAARKSGSIFHAVKKVDRKVISVDVLHVTGNLQF